MTTREEELWLVQSNSSDKINTQMCKFASSDRCTITWTTIYGNWDTPCLKSPIWQEVFWILMYMYRLSMPLKVLGKSVKPMENLALKKPLQSH